MFSRKCPTCSSVIIYKHYSNYRNGVRKNKICRSCANRKARLGTHLTDETKLKLSKYFSGDKNPAKRLDVRQKLSEKAKLRVGKLNPRYGCKLSNKHKEILRNVNLGKKHSIESIKKIKIARKQQFEKMSIEETLRFYKNSVEKSIEARLGIPYKKYIKTLPKFKIYKNKVNYITKIQPIHQLENFDKRGRAGNNGAYQLDHKISIFDGFHKNISPEIIGNIKNLRFIPWEENLKKGKLSV